MTGTETTITTPFAALSLIAAPALLTNAASLLALSTSNRFLRASDRMRALGTRLEEKIHPPEIVEMLLKQVDRVEKQGNLLLEGLRAAYMALGSFASASLISIVGAALTSAGNTPHTGQLIVVTLALLAGFIGTASLVWACANLFRATRISMQNISDEAALIRQRRESPSGPNTTGSSPLDASVSEL